MLIGITGGSGSGKSVVASEFEKAGCRVIDCDKAAREITEPGKPALSEIAREFGEEYIAPDGTLLRKKLGSLVFADSAALSRLNEIINTFIRRAVNEKIAAANSPIVCIDAPLLIEYGMDEICDRVIAVTAEEKIRIERICKRDGLSPEDAANRIKSQQNDKFYLEKADYIVYNNSTEENLAARAREIINELREML